VESAELVAAPVPRALATVRGRLQDLLEDPLHTALQDAWLQVTLTDPRRPQHAMERLRARFPHTLMLAFDPDGAAPARGPVLPRVDGRSDLDIALGFVAEVRDLEATTEEELLLQLACDSCRINGDRDADFQVTPQLMSGEDVG
jgi:exonuclease SbcD